MDLFGVHLSSATKNSDKYNFAKFISLLARGTTAPCGRSRSGTPIHVSLNLDQSIMAGDFNFDLRDTHHVCREQLFSTPEAEHFVLNNEARGGWGSFGETLSCNKERTPFQCQVTKIGQRDSSLKDYILVGSSIHMRACLHGTISTCVHLPNETIPSDHSMVLAEVWNSVSGWVQQQSDNNSNDTDARSISTQNESFAWFHSPQRTARSPLSSSSDFATGDAEQESWPDHEDGFEE